MNCQTCRKELPLIIEGTASQKYLGHIICPNCGAWNDVPRQNPQIWDSEIQRILEDCRIRFGEASPWHFRESAHYVFKDMVVDFSDQRIGEWIVRFGYLPFWKEKVVKIRRRLEDRLRKGTPEEILEIAQKLGVKID